VSDDVTLGGDAVVSHVRHRPQGRLKATGQLLVPGNRSRNRCTLRVTKWQPRSRFPLRAIARLWNRPPPRTGGVVRGLGGEVSPTVSTSPITGRAGQQIPTPSTYIGRQATSITRLGPHPSSSPWAAATERCARLASPRIRNKRPGLVALLSSDSCPHSRVGRAVAS
jgi:hypothetical protein